MQNLVSIIIPTYNEKKNIRRLLSSIKNQTCQEFEIIVVDDGSKDKTVQISKEFTKDVYIRKHAERSIQRNFGARVSHGRYLLFLDADMELEKSVIENCIKVANENDAAAFILPEKTVGKGLIAKIRNFERTMYMGDFTIEVARLFRRDVFEEFGGYDIRLTGPEDYDLPYRISKKYQIGRTSHYILHHEEGLTLLKLLKKRYYYAHEGALYARKHPELISTQGNLFFRKAFFRNWRNFLFHPIIGILFILIKCLEQIWAIMGFISSVGIAGFIKTLPNLFR